MKKAITIKSIAEELNLSRNTVSKALNGQYVPKKTREIVLKKAQELNYKSLSLKNAEMSDKKYHILLVSTRPLNSINYFISLVSSIENYCYERNYELFQYIYNSRESNFKRLSAYIKELNVDGIVAIECFDKEFISKLLQLDIPVCFHDFAHTSQSFIPTYDVVCTNDEQAVSSFIKSLYKKYKSTRFTFVGDNRHCQSFRKRYTGMLLGLRNSKIPHNPSDDINLSEESFDYGNIMALKEEISKINPLPEVFVCCNDFVARNVCFALKSMRIAVPENALVVGFDNAAESYSLSPALTTFSIDRQFLGAEIMRVLIDRIENKSIPTRFITISTSLIVRQSTEREGTTDNPIKKE